MNGQDIGNGDHAVVHVSPVELASSFEPLKRVSKREEKNVYTGSNMKRSEFLQSNAPNPLDVTAVAPYQAMPVHGPLITHNKASGLEVGLDNGHLSPEVDNLFGHVPGSSATRIQKTCAHASVFFGRNETICL